MSEVTQYSDTEERIFKAALCVFARKGKEGARMQEIADAAAINKAMLHYYFRSKDKLYEEVFRFVFQRFMLSLSNALNEAPTFAETLRVFIDGYVDLIREDPHVIRLMVNANLSGQPIMRGELKQEMLASQMHPPLLFKNKLQKAIASGEIRPLDPQQTLLTVMSSCAFFFVMRPTVMMMNEAAAQDWEGFVEDRKAHVFDLLYNGLRNLDASANTSA